MWIGEDRELDAKVFRLNRGKGQKREVQSDKDEIEGRCGR